MKRFCFGTAAPSHSGSHFIALCVVAGVIPFQVIQQISCISCFCIHQPMLLNPNRFHITDVMGPFFPPQLLWQSGKIKQIQFQSQPCFRDSLQLHSFSPKFQFPSSVRWLCRLIDWKCHICDLFSRTHIHTHSNASSHHQLEKSYILLTILLSPTSLCSLHHVQNEKLQEITPSSFIFYLHQITAK